MSAEDEVTGSRRAPAEKGGRADLTARLKEVDPRQLELFLDQLQATKAKKTFGQFAEEWRANVSRVWWEKERPRFEHLRPLFDFTESELTPRRVKDHLTALRRKGCAADYCNKIQATGKLIIAEAQLSEEWTKLNPFSVVRRMRARKKKRPTLTIPEARAALPFLREDRRWMAATMLSLGLRNGEELGLLKTAVDLRAKELLVHRSHERDETKTGEDRLVFIPDELVPILEEAIRKSPSETLVFADENGKQWRHDTNLTRTLGDALRKADVVTGYRYHCRRKGCGYKETRPEKLALRCPKCNFKLLVIGIPKKMRWYDLRHSCATLHRLAGADPLAVKVALGHARVDPTDDIYTHLTPAFQRRELNKLRLFEAPEPPAPKNGGGEGESLTSTKNESLLFRAETQTSICNESVSMSSNTAMGVGAGEHPTAGLLSRGSGVRAPRDSMSENAEIEVLSPSSRGPGRWPFKPVTRVRIPSGTQGFSSDSGGLTVQTCARAGGFVR